MDEQSWDKVINELGYKPSPKTELKQQMKKLARESKGGIEFKESLFHHVKEMIIEYADSPDEWNLDYMVNQLMEVCGVSTERAAGPTPDGVD